MTDVTTILSAIENGQARTSDLLPIVYDELRQLAARQMNAEQPGQTLQATALVHEAFLRLAGPGDQSVTWENRRHFFGAAALAMQRILVEQARQRKRLKHGGNGTRKQLSSLDAIAEDEVSHHDLMAVDEALDDLETVDARKAELVRLRYFARLTEEEAANALGISRATAARWWAFSKAWLFARIQGNLQE